MIGQRFSTPEEAIDAFRKRVLEIPQSELEIPQSKVLRQLV